LVMLSEVPLTKVLFVFSRWKSRWQMVAHKKNNKNKNKKKNKIKKNKKKRRRKLKEIKSLLPSLSSLGR